MHQNSYWTKLIYHVSAYVDYLVWKQDLKTLEILHVGLYKSLDRLCWKDSLWVEMIRIIHMLEIIIYNYEFSLKLKKNSILLHKPRSYMFESHENNLQPEMHILILLLDHK